MKSKGKKGKKDKYWDLGGSKSGRKGKKEKEGRKCEREIRE